MTGTIDHIKKYKGPWFFIMGDDGIRYHSSMKHVKDYNLKSEHFGKMLTRWASHAYVGARVEFDTTDGLAAEGTCPEAVNVVLGDEPDPDLERKIEARRAEAARRAEKAENRRKDEQRHISKMLEAKNLGYVVQKRVDGEWQNVRAKGKVVFCESADEGKQFINLLKFGGREGHFRIRKARIWRNLGDPSKSVITIVD